MKNKVIGISNGNVVSVKTGISDKMQHWEKLKSPSKNLDRLLPRPQPQGRAKIHNLLPGADL